MAQPVGGGRVVILESLITVTLANFSKTNFWMGLLVLLTARLTPDSHS